MNFRNYIYEELGASLSKKNAVDYKIEKKTSKYLIASFVVEEENYRFQYKNYGKEDFAGLKNLKFGEVSFYHKEKGTGLTGTGNVAGVFATVFQILKEAIDKMDPDIIFFDSSGGKGRTALYKRFADRASDLLPGYDAGEIERGNFAIYKKWVEEKWNETQ
jgi:hypothetical protein